MYAGSTLSRRRVIGALSIAGVGALIPSLAAAPADDRLETANVRLVLDPSACVAPEYVVEELLREEGFAEIGYVPVASDADDQKMLNENKADFALDFALKFVTAIDAGDPLTVLCGIHLGCFELFARESIRSLRDLKGKSIGSDSMGGSAPAFLVSLGAAIGFDARRDVRWVIESKPSPMHSSKASSTPSSRTRRRSSSCVPVGPAMCWSAATTTARGRSISAACWALATNMCASTRLRRSG
jgi:NitT/TauT family transport system substrate-binding protein